MKRLTSLCLGALLLTGCAGGATPSAPASTGPVTTGAGTYTFEAGGAKGAVNLPGDPNPAVAEAAALAGATHLTYVTVSLDNRQGTADLLLQEVTVYTVAGQEAKYKSADKYLGGLDTSALSIEDGLKITAVINTVNDPVRVGESRKVTMVGPDPLPEEIVRVTVSL